MESFHIVKSQKIGFEDSIDIKLEYSDFSTVSKRVFCVGCIQGNYVGFHGGGGLRFDLADYFLDSLEGHLVTFFIFVHGYLGKSN